MDKEAKKSDETKEPEKVNIGIKGAEKIDLSMFSASIKVIFSVVLTINVAIGINLWFANQTVSNYIKQIESMEEVISTMSKKIDSLEAEIARQINDGVTDLKSEINTLHPELRRIEDRINDLNDLFASFDANTQGILEEFVLRFEDADWRFEHHNIPAAPPRTPPHTTTVPNE